MVLDQYRTPVIHQIRLWTHVGEVRRDGHLRTRLDPGDGLPDVWSVPGSLSDPRVRPPRRDLLWYGPGSG